jgi:hypothetical protein
MTQLNNRFRDEQVTDVLRPLIVIKAGGCIGNAQRIY